MMGDRVDRYERLMVALTVHLAPHGAATCEAILVVFRETRRVLGTQTMTDDAVSRRIAELLHEGVIVTSHGFVVPQYFLAGSGLVWVLENVAALGVEDAAFREALVRCGLNPDEALRKIFRVREAQRSLKAIE
jgi:hypothetical protein